MADGNAGAVTGRGPVSRLTGGSEMEMILGLAWYWWAVSVLLGLGLALVWSAVVAVAVVTVLVVADGGDVLGEGDCQTGAVADCAADCP